MRFLSGVGLNGNRGDLGPVDRLARMVFVSPVVVEEFSVTERVHLSGLVVLDVCGCGGKQ
jgi:hypothetical protein